MLHIQKFHCIFIHVHFHMRAFKCIKAVLAISSICYELMQRCHPIANHSQESKDVIAKVIFYVLPFCLIETLPIMCRRERRLRILKTARSTRLLQRTKPSYFT